MPFYRTKKAIFIPAINGTLSFVSSALVLFLIFRSRCKSSYHRIMAVFAFWDMVSSFAVALTTLPMPSDVSRFYKYAGRSYGNSATCSVQGFAILLGLGFTLSSTLVLSIYYLCMFRYKIDDKKWQRVELMLWAVLTCCVLLVPVTMLHLEMINAGPFETYCMAGVFAYPWTPCKGQEVERGSRSIAWAEDLFNNWNAAFCGLVLLLQIVSMILILCTVHAHDTMEANLSSESNKSSTQSQEEEDHQESETNKRASTIKVIAVQASMYIIASLLTWSFTVISLFWEKAEWVSICKQLFNPLQGFLNAIIFVYHKVYTLRKSDIDLNFGEGLYKVLFETHLVPEVLISSVRVVDSHTFARQFRKLRNVCESDYESSCGVMGNDDGGHEPAPPCDEADNDVTDLSALNNISFVNSAIGETSFVPSAIAMDGIEDLSILSK